MQPSRSFPRAMIAACAIAWTLPASSYALVLHVTHLGDTGMGSLRAVIGAANANPGVDTIVFDVAGTITVSTVLPAITDNETRIHGETAPGGGTPPRITIQAGAVLGYGLLIDGANDCVVRGVRVSGFTIGIDVANAATSNAIGQSGLGQMNVATACTTGIRLRDLGTTDNVLLNNRVYGNSRGGISLRGASQNVIGGLGANEANECHSNEAGIVLDGSVLETSLNIIIGNRVGTDLSGSAPGLGNALHGILMRGPNCNQNLVSTNVIVNTIEGNGITRDGGGGQNKIAFNMIGMNVTGTAPLPNAGQGIYMIAACNADTIGPGNVISANGENGIGIIDDQGNGHHIYGNKIGTDVSGGLIFANLSDGIELRGDDILIGGITPAHGNLIRGNVHWGIYGSAYQDIGSGNTMWANEISQNGFGGIHMDDGMVNNLIGHHPAAIGLPNNIHDNMGPGVMVGPLPPITSAEPVEIKILTNVLVANSIAIDLIEYHDVGTDFYGNDFIPSPLILSASSAGSTVSGDKNLPLATATYIQVFWSDGGAGFGFVGDTNVPAGTANWNVVGTFPAGSLLYATNTALYAGNPSPETSEFSIPFVDDPTDAPNVSEEISSFELKLAGPNPSRGSTRLSFSAPMATELRLDVHDLGGRLVKTLWNGSVAAGTHSIEWDGNDDDGLRVNSGIYFVRARSGEFQKVERVLRVR